MIPAIIRLRLLLLILKKRSFVICENYCVLKQGERGLRQSDALFQHLENLPPLLEEALSDGRNRDIRAVCTSDRPRPVEGSYMPVFKAGIGFGQAVAAALQVPHYMFSHQEGHIEAIRAYSQFAEKEAFLCYHLSGGTCEHLKVEPGSLTKIGGCKRSVHGTGFGSGWREDGISVSGRRKSGPYGSFRGRALLRI